MNVKKEIKKNKKLLVPKNITQIANYEKFYNRVESFSRKCSMYPNFGVGFTILNKYDKKTSYYILSSKFKGYFADFYGKKVSSESQGIEKLKNLNQYSIVNYNYECVNNGNIYKLQQLHDQIKEKEKFLKFRTKHLASI